MVHALVTGGAGFIGSHLSEHLLESGYQVTVVDNASALASSNLRKVASEVTLVCEDVGQRQVLAQIKDVQVVYHLAGNPNIALSSEDPMFDATANILTSINVLDFARERSAAVLLASSAAVYGNPTYVPTDEDHPLIPVSPYGQSKVAAEGYFRLYRRYFGVRAQIVRYFNAYGERQRRFAVWDFANRLHEPDPEFTVLGTGEQQRSFLHVTDAARATRIVAEAGVPGPINIGSDTVLNVLDLVRELSGIFGVSKPVRCSGASWPGDIVRMIPDIRALKGLGFREQVSLQQGLAQFRQWYLAEGQPR